VLHYTKPTLPVEGSISIDRTLKLAEFVRLNISQASLGLCKQSNSFRVPSGSTVNTGQNELSRKL
jgi:hypothetical protein